MKPISMTNRLSMNGAPLRAFFLLGLLLAAAVVSQAQVTFTEYPVPTVAGGPRGITAGPDGNLWFTEAELNKIGRITTAGVITEFSGAGLPLPERIAAGADVFAGELQGCGLQKRGVKRFTYRRTSLR